ncbi:MAG: type II toxin-antitoxin system HicA family toxin [Acidobacteria bacterium]|nr:type II toxin-antitoxin system HicA family toxin [Acidobacteriota bacterium]
MSRLAPVSRRELIRRLRQLGFDGPFSGGRHQFMVRNEIRLVIPNPHRSAIGVELLRRILRHAAIDLEEWRTL